MATFTSASGARLVKKDSTTSADTYVVLDNSKGLVLTGNANGDTIKIDGLSTDFTFKASGKTLTLTSVDDSSFRIQVQIANGGSVILGFLDGGVTASYASTGSSKGVTLAGSAGSQKLTSKAVALADAVSVNEATASVDTFDTTTTTTTTGSSVDLTVTAGETASGTSGDDTFNGIIGTTFQTGDIVNGGSGGDSLNLLAADAGSRVLASLNSVETVAVRSVGSAALNAITWSGVNTVNLTSESISGTTTVLDITNASVNTQFAFEKGATLRLDVLDDSSTTDSLAVKINPSTSGSVYVVDASAAAITTLALSVSGAAANTGDVQYFGSSTTAFTVAGTGTVVLDLAQGATNNAAVSSVSYAGFSGVSRTLISGQSQLGFTGNSGNDTLSLGGEGSLTSADTLAGGGGTDTLKINADNLGSNVFERVTSFEQLEATLVSSSIDTGISGFSQLTFIGGTALTDVLVSGLDGGATVDLNLATGRNVRLGYSGAVANVDLQYASGGSKLELNAFKVSGATSVDLDFGAATATDIGFTSFLNVEEARTVSLDVGKSASVSAASFGASGATTISLAASGDGAVLGLVSNNTTGVADLNIDTVGSARMTIGVFSGLANNATVDVNVGSSGSVNLGGFGRASDGGDAAVTVSVAQSGALASAGNIQLSSGNLSLTLTVGKDSDANFGDLEAGGGAVGALAVNVGVGGSADVGNVSGNTLSSILASGAASGVITIGSLRGSGIGTVDLRLGVSAVGTVGAASSTTSIGNISGSVGNYATGTIGSLNASASIGTITFSVGDGAELNLGSANAAGSAATVGAIALTGASGADISLEEVSAGGNIGNIAVTLADQAIFSALNIQSLSGTIGTITVSVGSAASARFGTVSAEASIGAVSLSGGSATVLLTSLAVGSGDISSVSIGDDTRVTISSIEASGLGSLSVAGDAAVINVSATNVGGVTLTGSGATITFDSADQNIGDITIKGSGQITVDLNNASSVGSVNSSGHAATATIDLSDIASGASVTLGASANKVVLSSAADTLTFRNGTGTDSVYFTQTSKAADDFGRFFQFGTTTDSVSFGTANFKLGFGSATAAVGGNSAGALDIAVVSANADVRELILGGSADFDTATDLVIFADSAFASVTDMLTDLRGFSGANGTTAGAGLFTGAQSVLVLWYDSTNGRTELSLVNASSNAETLSSAIPAAATGLAYFDVNITTVSATTFGQFFTYNDAQTL